jgi:DNA double-strand break repair helicase HerA and related ATPase
MKRGKRVSQILIGQGEKPVHLLAKYGNRHGLVAGATGTGKTVSLMVLAEGFSRMGVPVFMADVKGDVSGLAMAGVSNDKIRQRVAQLKIEDYVNEANPVLFWPQTSLF